LIARRDDLATPEAVASRRTDGLPLRMVWPGLVQARNAGLEACRTDVLPIKDDDTVRYPDWLARVLDHFVTELTFGGLSGRTGVTMASASMIASRRWLGACNGLVTLSVVTTSVRARLGKSILKGTNMSYRVRTLARLCFNACLRGTGAQPMEDMVFSRAVKRSDSKLLHDPLVAVDHYPLQREAPRHYTGITTIEDKEGLFDCARNEVVARWKLLTHFGLTAYVVRRVSIGTGVCPGLLQAVCYTPRFVYRSWNRFINAQIGRIAAFKMMPVMPCKIANHIGQLP
jgi:hypothetical protein